MKKTVEAFEQFLSTNQFLTEEQIQKVRKDALVGKMSFKRACLKLGYMTEEGYVLAESRFYEIPLARIDDYIVDPAILKLIPLTFARQNSVFPLFRIDDTLTIAVHDPGNIFAIDQIREMTKLDVDTVLVTEADIVNAIREYYASHNIVDQANVANKKMQQTFIETKKPKSETIQLGTMPDMVGSVDDAPVIKLVDQTILQALEDKASDIHIEPEHEFVRVRNRIDGSLIEIAQLPKSLLNPIVSRIKIMAKLDIAESRKPQDGKIRISTNGRDVDIRVSSFPTMYGENIVLRILDRSSVVLDLNRLGFSTGLLESFRGLLTRPHGIVLVTGPTGAGKTTTLYAALSTINTVEKNIVTIEDPVEYQIPLIRQTQVNVKAGLTFAAGLRSLLRQDPDVMLVGEIRDRETAEVAVESALTGHLVFATLHTNDAPGAITRLVDMGVEPFLLASSLAGVLAQRLVRLICSQCKKEKTPAELHISDADYESLVKLHKLMSSRSKSQAPLKLYQGEGCKTCKRTGFKGRVAIFELMVVDEKVRYSIAHRAPTAEIRNLVFSENVPSLKLDGMMKVIAGLTTLEEVWKVVQED